MNKIFFCFTILSLVISPIALGGGFSNLDIGTQRCGMLGIVATGSDPTMVYHNPANLVEEEDDQILVGVNSVIIGTEIQIRYPDQTLSENLEPDLAFGFVPFMGYSSKFGTDKFAGAIAFYFPNLFAASMPDEAVSRYLASDAIFITGYLTPAAAVKISDKLQVGLGLDMIYTYISMDRAFNMTSYIDDDFRNYDESYDFWFNIEGNDIVYSLHGGVTYKPIDRLKLSAVYYKKADIKLEGDSSGRIRHITFYRRFIGNYAGP